MKEEREKRILSTINYKTIGHIIFVATILLCAVLALAEVDYFIIIPIAITGVSLEIIFQFIYGLFYRLDLLIDKK